MCSFLVQIVYGVVGFVATAMTIVAMFTPGWSQNTWTGVGDIIEDIDLGIFPFTCALPSDDVKPGTIFNWNDCQEWYDSLPWTEKVVVACMCLALCFQVVAFVWNIFSIFACCCKRFTLHILSFFTTIATILLIVAVAFYAIFFEQYIGQKDPVAGVPQVEIDSYFGYSYWLACGSLALSIVNMIVASAAMCCAKKHL